ncbi:hypothetical protein [Nibribacter koreensis]|uniref:Uncharacterized protein n=1 Tax=Nibribacter koreensis TaxID=1084519 RepID=A0ABP8FU79_9BACT
MPEPEKERHATKAGGDAWNIEELVYNILIIKLFVSLKQQKEGHGKISGRMWF